MGLRYQKYRNSALASWKISDAFAGLSSSGYLAPDVETAARVAPLRFHPKHDPALFNRDGGWWHVTHDVATDVSARINHKFDGWYGTTDRVQKAYLTIVGLMVSGEFIDETIDRVTDKLCERHRWTIIDGDDTIEEIEDQKAIADPTNIAAVLDLPELRSACTALSRQIRRMVASPTADLQAINNWHQESIRFQNRIAEYFHSNVYARTGISPTRARKAIAKSYDLLKQFVGKERARAFIHGEELLIPAKQFTWGLTLRPGEIIEKTIDPSRAHTPFRIQLYDSRVSPDALCSGCVLWPGTPVLDQAVGFILATADPDEEVELLMEMNFQSISKQVRENPLLAQKLERGDSYWREEYREIIDLREEALDIDVTEIETPHTVETENLAPENWVDDVVIETISEPERVRIDDDADISDDEFNRRWAIRISNQRAKYKRERMQNPLTQRIQGMLFDRIDGPREMLEQMANPGVYYWTRDHITEDNLPEHVVNYVTEKRFV